MNKERIKQLMSVAFDTVSGDDKQWCIKYSEKFAELIVRECALQCVHNEDMDLIEKHFGVEE